MTSDISAAQLLKAYEEMLLIRRFEEKSGQLYGMGMIAGFCHLYIGQEAVAVGVQHTLVKGDAVITSYRDHGIMLATGSDPKSVMAELLGKAGGCSQGKGGSMHMFDLEKGFFGGHGIVGAQVPIGTGIAFAHKYNNSKSVAVTYFGDGACNQGQVYEAFNMAKLWNLPVLYIIENNEYGMGTSVERSCSTTDLYKRGASFEIPGEQVNGMSYIDVYKATAKAIEKIRAGFGPYIIEVKTYRYRGHSMSDPGKYRSKEEVEEVKTQHDAIDFVKNLGLNVAKISEAEFETIEKRVKDIMKDVIEFAQSSPEPDEAELYTDILVEG
jgi:pyruvate dehydrogenase E1 component alpha subunit